MKRWKSQQKLNLKKGELFFRLNEEKRKKKEN